MSESTATVTPVQSPKFVQCTAGIRTNEKGWREIWVRSPRTNKVITITEPFWAQLREAAPRLIGRIVAARSVGRSAMDLSTNELKALVDVQSSRKAPLLCKPSRSMSAR